MLGVSFREIKDPGLVEAAPNVQSVSVRPKTTGDQTTKAGQGTPSLWTASGGRTEHQSSRAASGGRTEQ